MLSDIQCSVPSDPDNGVAHYTSSIEMFLRPGTLVHYRCNVGYTLEGSDAATCLRDGNWSAPMPMCLTGLYA